MIHDIDLALALTAAEPVSAEGEGDDDQASAEVTFDDGFVASFAVSRIAEARDRRMRIVYPSGEVAIDFLARSFSNTTPFTLNAAFAETPAGRDPLGVSVQAFLDAAGGKPGLRPGPWSPPRKPPARWTWPWRSSRRSARLT